MTGGGIYPALAVLQALKNKNLDILWVGSRGEMEKNILAGYEVSFRSIPAAGIHGVNLMKLPKNTAQLIKGWRESKRIIQEFKPEVIFYTGGYLGVPMSLAAGKIQSVVFVPDVKPGMALKMILKSADKIAVSTKLSLPYINKNKDVYITGYPIRNDIKKWDRQKSRAHFKIPANAKVLLVFGGSKGARSINNALLSILEKLTTQIHVIHITGVDNWDKVQSQLHLLKLSCPQNYQAFPFLREGIGAAFAAADLALCRAGASIIGELPYFGLPAILVPYPYAWHYQHQNAEYLINNNAAVLIEDNRLASDLYKKIQTILFDDKKIELMRKNLKKLKKNNAAESIANLILESGQIMQKGEGKW
ncbi:MAG: undecaprenyldiphospho-muramoylpentapeptide beta-N-acetylglucosaminyltransferase [Anaerolineaceae bacterium]|nr:undecaprenyldiphospho-muramoylpentapeptide beta-N-acetylglucosaminyltransferase [Anaerolineaceae bacterium]